ncbi:MAG: ADOP family duplicated permease [Vicinamibacterales bacterium]
MRTPPRVCRWLVAAGAALVPAHQRDEWRREWLAELHAALVPAAARTPPSAAALAARCLGALVHAGWLRWQQGRLDMWAYDVRIAARSLGRQPAFTAVAVLTLALGIGVNAAVFSAVYAVLLRPLPFPAPDRLVAVATTSARGPATGTSSSPPDFTDWHDGASSFAALAALSTESFAVSGTAPAEQVAGAAVTGEFFDVLGAAPALGRGLTAGDAASGAAPVAVLSDRLWARRFGRDDRILGGPVTIDGVTREVVGILPPGVAYPLDADVWVPLGFSPRELETQRGAMYLDVVGRLQRGRTRAEAEADLKTIAGRLAAAYPRTNDERSVLLTPLRDEIVGGAGASLLMLLAAAGLVLLVVSVNVAGLVLTRAIGHSQDLALRAALGAAPWRLVRGALAEAFVLAGAGGLAGLGLAWAGVRWVATLEAAGRWPLLAGTRLDTVTLAATAAVVTLVAHAVGAAPDWRTARAVRLAGAHEGLRATTSVRSRTVLVVAELALALVLVIGALTLLRSFARMTAVPRGFDVSDTLLTTSLTLPEARYDAPALRAGYVERALAGVRALPGVEAAGAVFGLPLTGFGYSITVSTRDGVALPQTPQEEVLLAVRAVTPDYFRAMGIQVRRGRAFQAGDAAGQPRVVMVDETAARLLWPDADPLGRSLEIGTHLAQREFLTGGTVVGVAANLREGAVDRPLRPTLYVPHAQEPTGFVSLAIRGAGRVPDAAAVRSVLNGLDPDVPLFRVRTTADLARSVAAEPRLLMALMSLFAAAALVVSAVGLYGMVAQSVAARAREIGVRRAVGATAFDVVALVARHVVTTMAAGSAVGLGASWLVSRVLDRFVFEPAGPDGVAYAAAVATLACAAGVAALVPCRRALAVDPTVALRAE